MAIKDQFSKYETVEDCLNDIRQVWENCRLFNAEGSEIYDTADSLHAELEEMVEVRVHVRTCVLVYGCTCLRLIGSIVWCVVLYCMPAKKQLMWRAKER